MSSATAKPKPAEDERLRDAWVTLPLLLPIPTRDSRLNYEMSRDLSIRALEYQREMTRRYGAGGETEFHAFDVRVRPEAVTGVSRQEGPDGTIILINGVQRTCRMSPKAIWELLL